jgi:ketosteroid isomerase-like protein
VKAWWSGCGCGGFGPRIYDHRVTDPGQHHRMVGTAAESALEAVEDLVAIASRRRALQTHRVRLARPGILTARSIMTIADHDSTNDNVALIEGAYRRYANGDLAAILELVDPDLEWTYLDPAESDPAPQVCHGRHELKHALERQRRQGLRSQLEEIIGRGDQVVVVTRTPGLDAIRARQAEDRNVDVFTIKAGRVVALRACRDRDEALTLAGIV